MSSFKFDVMAVQSKTFMFWISQEYQIENTLEVLTFK